MSFANTGLSDVLSHSLGRLGYTQPTPIQSKSIPVVLSGADLLARAQTGTGKTAAFGLPMIERLLVRSRRRPAARTMRGLVLVPTRELALQVERALATYGAPVNANVVGIVGGVAMRPQVEALRKGVDIVVATPGRLIDHMQQGTVNLSGVESLTLDEADRLLDMGFLPSLRRVLKALPAARQTLLFSATLSADVARLAAEFTREPVRVDVSGAEAVTPNVTHRVHAVGEGGKGEALARVLLQPPAGRALVFCKTKRRSDRVGVQLVRAGITAAVIHGNKSQGARNRALGDFKAGRVSVLVATDIAARGLDIAHLPLVVNYDLPAVAEDYVHRVGRTGRAGRAGRAVSLVSTEDRGLLPAIQRLLPGPLEEVVLQGSQGSTGGARRQSGTGPQLVRAPRR
ncbi:MAG TPA: DEAD/DEAH box helicase [Vicinamibacterales bacterium]|nr:DEAD/DEAH box helicase [Vicinamibacterales bacterium]